jgi:hypothetical protein
MHSVLTKGLKPRVLVFAHIPPPHHGQSVMVELMLRGLQNDTGLSVFHVDTRLSDELEDIGGVSVSKLCRLLSFCFKALGIRFRHGPMQLYYVPAPAKKSAIIRDWIVMALLRPWFSETILHWHAAGLGNWATGDRAAPTSSQYVFSALLDPLARFLTRLIMGKADRSIILTEADRDEVALFKPRRIDVIPNGIPDPCPLFETEVMPSRTTASTEEPFRCLYLAHCTRDKGLFDAMKATSLANALLTRQGSHRRITLTIAGSFMNETERREYEDWIKEMPESAVRHVGFVSGPEKWALLRSHECLVSFSRRETFGLNVVEALAFGMLPCLSPIAAYAASFSQVAIIAKEMTPAAYAAALTECVVHQVRPEVLRAYFLQSFTDKNFVQRITEALKGD